MISAVSFHSLGALSVVIDRNVFSTYYFDSIGANASDFITWLHKKDDRLKVLLVDNVKVVKRSHLNNLGVVRLLVNDTPDNLKTYDLLPLDCEFNVNRYDIKKLTCRNINQLLGETLNPIPASLTPDEITGSKQGELLDLIKGVLDKNEDYDRNIFKTVICRSLVYVPYMNDPALYKVAERSITSKLHNFMKENKENLFKSYISVLLGDDFKMVCDGNGVNEKDLRLIIKYVPLQWYNFNASFTHEGFHV
jgi:hypothetical protein